MLDCSTIVLLSAFKSALHCPDEQCDQKRSEIFKRTYCPIQTFLSSQSQHLKFSKIPNNDAIHFSIDVGLSHVLATNSINQFGGK